MRGGSQFVWPNLDYFPTRFDNAVNDHQNNFRFSAGVAFRF